MATVVDAFPYTPTYTDVDSSLSSVSSTGVALPGWVTLDALTGTLDGVVPAVSVDVVTGPHKLGFFDGTNTVDSNEFSIKVIGDPTLPAYEESYENVAGWARTTPSRASLGAAVEAYNEPYEFAGGWARTTSARASLASATEAYNEPYEIIWLTPTPVFDDAAVYDEPFEFAGGWDETVAAVPTPTFAAAAVFDEPFEYAGGWEDTDPPVPTPTFSDPAVYDEGFEFSDVWDETVAAVPTPTFAAAAVYDEGFDTSWDGTP